MKSHHYESYDQYARRIAMWHKKFLWLPTRVDDKNSRWLEFTWRRGTAFYGDFGYSAITEYEYLPYTAQKPSDNKILVLRKPDLTRENFSLLWNQFSYKQKPNLKIV